MAQQSIHCNVNTCKFNDKTDMCTKSDIHVGGSGAKEAHVKSETECDSFAE